VSKISRLFLKIAKENALFFHIQKIKNNRLCQKERQRKKQRQRLKMQYRIKRKRLLRLLALYRRFQKQPLSPSPLAPLIDFKSNPLYFSYSRYNTPQSNKTIVSKSTYRKKSIP